MRLSVCLSVQKVYCDKKADWIWMPFGVMSGVGRGWMYNMTGGNRRRVRADMGVNVRRPIATNGDFVA